LDYHDHVFHDAVFGGRLGKIKLDKIVDTTKPTMAMVIKILVTDGRFLDKTVTLKLSPPNNNGIQPITAMIKALVAQE